MKTLGYHFFFKINREEILKKHTAAVCKNGNRKSRPDNYRPGKMPPSKIVEEGIFHQSFNFMDEFLLKYRRDYREGYSAKYCVLAVL